MPTPGPPPRRIASWPSPARLRRPARRAHRSTRHSSRARRTGRQRLRQPQARPRTPGACLCARGRQYAGDRHGFCPRPSCSVPPLPLRRPAASAITPTAVHLAATGTDLFGLSGASSTDNGLLSSCSNPSDSAVDYGQNLPPLTAVKTSVHEARHLLPPTPADAPTTNAPCCIGVENWGYGSGVSIAANPNTVRCSIHHH